MVALAQWKDFLTCFCHQWKARRYEIRRMESSYSSRRQSSRSYRNKYDEQYFMSLNILWNRLSVTSMLRKNNLLWRNPGSISWKHISDYFFNMRISDKFCKFFPSAQTRWRYSVFDSYNSVRNNVEITLNRSWFNVMTLKQFRFNILPTLCAQWRAISNHKVKKKIFWKSLLRCCIKTKEIKNAFFLCLLSTLATSFFYVFCET